MERSGDANRSVGPILIFSGIFVISLVVILHFIDAEDFGFGEGFHDKLPHIVNVLAGLAVILVVSGVVIFCKYRFCGHRERQRPLRFRSDPNGLQMEMMQRMVQQSVAAQAGYPQPNAPPSQPLSQSPPAYGFTPSLYPQATSAYPSSSFSNPDGGFTPSTAFASNSFAQQNQALVQQIAEATNRASSLKHGSR